MNTLIVSTFDCSFEDFDKFVADFHKKEGNKYVEEYELIKVNEHKSHLILEVKTEAPKLKVVEIKEEEVKAEEVKSEELNASEFKEEAE